MAMAERGPQISPPERRKPLPILLMERGKPPVLPEVERQVDPFAGVLSDWLLGVSRIDAIKGVILTTYHAKSPEQIGALNWVGEDGFKDTNSLSWNFSEVSTGIELTFHRRTKNREGGSQMWFNSFIDGTEEVFEGLVAEAKRKRNRKLLLAVKFTDPASA